MKNPRKTQKNKKIKNLKKLIINYKIYKIKKSCQ